MPAIDLADPCRRMRQSAGARSVAARAIVDAGRLPVRRIAAAVSRMIWSPPSRNATSPKRPCTFAHSLRSEVPSRWAYSSTGHGRRRRRATRRRTAAKAPAASTCRLGTQRAAPVRPPRIRSRPPSLPRRHKPGPAPARHSRRATASPATTLARRAFPPPSPANTRCPRPATFPPPRRCPSELPDRSSARSRSSPGATGVARPARAPRPSPSLRRPFCVANCAPGEPTAAPPRGQGITE